MSRSRPQIDVTSSLIDPARPIEETPIDWTALFGNDRPVELEIGSGKGLFLVNSASANTGHNFLGIELSRKYARLCAERLVQREISNAKVWRGDARLVMTQHVPGLSLRAIHVYFPDPWWKKRHKKRRVFTASLMTEIERTLETGGHLHVASDVEEYFALIRGLIAAHPRFLFLDMPIPEPKEAQHPSDYLTNFERKYRIEGRPIYRADYVLDRIVSAD